MALNDIVYSETDNQGLTLEIPENTIGRPDEILACHKDEIFMQIPPIVSSETRKIFIIVD